MNAIDNEVSNDEQVKINNQKLKNIMYVNKHYLNNREKVLAYKKSYYALNCETIKQKTSARYFKNKDILSVSDAV